MTAITRNDAAHWFVIIDGKEEGPINLHELGQRLDSGQLTEESLIRLDFWDRTVRIGQLGGLTEMRRLEARGAAVSDDELFAEDDLDPLDPEVASLTRRLSILRALQTFGLVVIGGWIVVAALTLLSIGFRGWPLLTPAAAAMAVWYLLSSIAISMTSSAISNRCLLLNARRQRNVHR